MQSHEVRELLESNFTFPFRLHDYQIETIVQATAAEGIGGVLFRDGVGVGKTAIATGYALLHSITGDVEQILAIMPPVLMEQFAEFMRSIKGVDIPLMYVGTPKQRLELAIERYPVVIMSYNIFRSDFARIIKWSKKTKLAIIADELSLKSSGKTYKCVKELIYGKLRVKPGIDLPYHKFCALNATPISKREQVYWWCAVFKPECYWSQAMFDARHVGSKDHWGNVTSWANTQEMDDNFDSFSAESKNVSIEIPESAYIELPYKLTKKHLDLYNDVADAEFAKLPEEMIEMAVASMFSVLQRVVLLPHEFGLDVEPPILELLDSRLGQMQPDDSVLIFTRHVAVSKMLTEHIKGCVSVFGGVKNRQQGIDAFKAGEAQVMVANIDSLSKGANLQVANHTICVELPFRSDALIQLCGRTARQGQKRNTFFHFPLATDTIQRKIYRNLLKNDVDLLRINRRKRALKDFINVEQG